MKKSVIYCSWIIFFLILSNVIFMNWALYLKDQIQIHMYEEHVKTSYIQKYDTLNSSYQIGIEVK